MLPTGTLRPRGARCSCRFARRPSHRRPRGLACGGWGAIFSGHQQDLVHGRALIVPFFWFREDKQKVHPLHVRKCCHNVEGPAEHIRGVSTRNLGRCLRSRWIFGVVRHGLWACLGTVCEDVRRPLKRFPPSWVGIWDVRCPPQRYGRRGHRWRRWGALCPSTENETPSQPVLLGVRGNARVSARRGMDDEGRVDCRLTSVAVSCQCSLLFRHVRDLSRNVRFHSLYVVFVPCMPRVTWWVSWRIAMWSGFV